MAVGMFGYFPSYTIGSLCGAGGGVSVAHGLTGDLHGSEFQICWHGCTAHQIGYR